MARLSASHKGRVGSGWPSATVCIQVSSSQASCRFVSRQAAAYRSGTNRLNREGADLQRRIERSDQERLRLGEAGRSPIVKDGSLVEHAFQAAVRQPAGEGLPAIRGKIKAEP